MGCVFRNNKRYAVTKAVLNHADFVGANKFLIKINNVFMNIFLVFDAFLYFLYIEVLNLYEIFTDFCIN